ncbi:hypothetical protein [Streptomyces sp. RKAG337]|uniref:hypothetical protein n=1 Tax=Streptomyces sp. RKAG337 TaxID=2893404 RepID=UPI0020345693|nr:hypothetical protein [Streptomyces sp. RKAG337]MCM2430908.1 hypothetical protein [Streptomyces sp. RKAG337]
MESALITAAVHLKVTRTVVYDVALPISLPAEIAACPGALRRYVEDLQPGVLSAACTEEAIDRITDVALLDVLGIDIQTPEIPDAGERHDR